MSKTVDKKVVEMQFDNSNFESNVRTSMSTLDKLKEKLNFSGTAKAFEELDRAAASTTFSGLTSGLETISSKFSALDTIAFTTLQHITESAISTGEQLIKSLSIDQITAGWTKFDEKNTGVATIMNATGKSVDEVNESLAKLNWFTDETSYNFTDMINNIGKFTSNGVELDKAVTAMEGISTAAALAGQNATAAGRVMYNFSQALGMGSVKLQDWMSVENANMATKEFKETIIATAKELGRLDAAGTILDPAEKYSGPEQVTFENFRNTLSAAWFDADVLIGALKKYGDFTDQLNSATEEVGITTTEMLGYLSEFTDGTLDMATLADETGVSAARLGQIFENLGSDTHDLGRRAFKAAQEAKTFQEAIDATKDAVSTGWMNTFEIIFGNYEEAKELWTELAEVLWEAFASGAEARNELLSDWKELGGRDDLIEAFRNVATALETVITPIREGFAEIFPPITYEKLKDLTQGIENFTARLIISKDSAEKLNRVVQGIAAAIDIVVFTIQTGAKVAFEFLLDTLNSTGFSLLNFTTNISGNIVAFRDWIRESGKLEEAFKGIRNVVEEIAAPIKAAFVAIFPDDLAKNITDKAHTIKDVAKNIVGSIADVTNNFKLSEDTSDKLQRVFQGIFAIFDSIGIIIKDLIGSVMSLFGDVFSENTGTISEFGGTLLELAAAAGDNIVKFRDWIESSGSLEAILQKVNTIVQKTITFIVTLAANIGEFISQVSIDVDIPWADRIHTFFESVSGIIHTVSSKISGFFSKFSEAIQNSSIIELLEAVWNLLMRLGSAIIDSFGGSIENLVQIISTADLTTIIGLINSISFAEIIKLLKGISDNPIKEFGQNLSSLTEILDSVKGALVAWQNDIKSNTLLKIAISVAILAASIISLSFVDSQKISDSMGAISTVFIELMASMGVLSKMSSSLSGTSGIAGTMLAMAAAIAILAHAIIDIASLNTEQLVNGVAGIGVIMSELIATTLLLQGSDVPKGVANFILFAAAIKLLGSAAIELADLSWEEIAKGLVGVAGLLAELVIVSRTIGDPKHLFSIGLAFIEIAAALNIMVPALVSMAALSWEEITKGLVGIAGSLIAVTAAVNFMPKNMTGIGIGLIAVGAALNIIASAMTGIAILSWEEIAKGLVGIGVALGEIAVAMNFMPKNMIGIGIGLITVGAAINIIAGAMSSIASLSWEEIAKGLVGIGASLLELSVALMLMEGTAAGSAALLVAAVALGLLAPTLKLLGGMSWSEIAKGLGAIAGALAIIGIAGLALGPVVPSILALGGALALIGAGVGIAAAGLALLSIAFVSFTTAVSGGSTAIVAAISAIILGIIALMPQIIEQIGLIIISIAKVVSDGAPAIGEAIKALVLTTLNVIMECVPQIVETAMRLLTEVLTALNAYGPELINQLIQFVIMLIHGIAEHVPDLLSAVVDLVQALVGSVLEAFSLTDFSSVVEAIEGVGLLAALMVAFAGISSLTGAAMIGVLGMGAVIAEMAAVLAALGGIAQIPGVDWILQEGKEFLGKIGEAIGAFVGGIAAGAIEEVSSTFPKIGSDLSAFMQNAQEFITGASEIDNGMLDGVNALVKTVLLLTAADLLNGIASWITGGSSLVKFGEELSEFGPLFKAYADSVEGIDTSVVEASSNAALALAQMADTLPNKGGILGWFFGENTLSDFGEELTQFGPNLKSFAESVEGIDAESVKGSAEAVAVLAEMADSLPNSGGILAKITGDNSLNGFADELISLGPKLKEYANTVSGVDISAVTASGRAITSLVEVVNALPNSGGFISLFTGDNTLNNFGKQIVSFGKSVKEYYDYIAGIDISTVGTAKTIQKNIVEFINTLSLESVDMLKIFEQELGHYGSSIKTFSADMSKVKFEDFKNAIDHCRLLIDLLASTKVIDERAVETFSNSFEIMSSSAVSKFIENFNNSHEKAKTAITDFLISVSNSINSEKQVVFEATNQLINGIIQKFTDHVSDFSNCGVRVCDEIGRAIADNSSTASDKMSELVIGMVNAVNNMYSTAYSSGINFGNGIINGLNAVRTNIVETARNLARSAINTVNSELGIHSPSTVMMESGENTGIGFVNGLKSMIPSIFTTSELLGQSAANGLTDTVSAIASLLEDNVETEPVIRPVLDLTEIQNGSKKIGQLTSGVGTYTLNRSIENAEGAAYYAGYRQNVAVEENGSGDPVPVGVGSTYNNVFNISGESPKEIANEVSRILRHQVERKDASWA